MPQQVKTMNGQICMLHSQKKQKKKVLIELQNYLKKLEK